MAGQEGPQEKQHPCSTKNTVRTIAIPLPSLAHLLTLGFPFSPPPWHLCPGRSVCIRHPVAVVGEGGGCGGDRLPPRVGAPGCWGSRQTQADWRWQLFQKAHPGSRQPCRRSRNDRRAGLRPAEPPGPQGPWHQPTPSLQAPWSEDGPGLTPGFQLLPRPFNHLPLKILPFGYFSKIFSVST